MHFIQVSFSDWFLSKGGTRTSIQKMWDPVAYALGFIDCDNISARCMLTIFALFATKTEASLLRMLKGSPDVYLSGPIRKYITDRGGRYKSDMRFCLHYCPNFSLFRFSLFAETGSILGGDAEKYFMMNLLMGALMLKDFPCQR